MASPSQPHIPTLVGIVQEIYASLSEHMCFERSLAAVGCGLHSHISALHAVDLAEGRACLEAGVGMDPVEFSAMAGAYATRWAGKNLWIERGIPGLLNKGYGTGEAVVAERELVRSEYYQHFLKPVDIQFGMGILVLNEGRSRLSLITINRSKGAGPFRAEELQLVEQLRPHLVNAYSIYKKFTALQDVASSLRDTFNHAPIGMLVLDAGGNIVEENAAASRLLSTNSGICRALGHTLRLTCPLARVKLRDALTRLGGACVAPMPECLVIGQSSASGVGSLALHLCAFPASVSPMMVKNARILGFLCELGHHSEVDFGHHVLQSALNLTPMEAAVVMSLRERNDPMHVALHLGLAMSTVRTHLKHAFLKTGTTRQSELLRLADRLLSVAPN